MIFSLRPRKFWWNFGSIVFTKQIKADGNYPISGKNNHMREIGPTWACLKFREEQDALCLKSLRPTVKKSILIIFNSFSGYVPGRRAN